MIDFNIPPFVGTEIEYMRQAAMGRKICGDGPFTLKCQEWLRDFHEVPAAFLTTSGTSALEMAALLCGIEEGDEVILPSYTFCSTANAFVLRGARLVFADIRPDTLNLDETKLEEAITEKTRAIAVVHYAGVACEMDEICRIAAKHHLFVVEDAAQAIGSTYMGRRLGTIGHFNCLSFHETKNLSMGEGGALLLTSGEDRDRAEIYREKGTDRSRFFRGMVDKYTWQDQGSSYLPSDLNAAYLWGELLAYDTIQDARMEIWNTYREAFGILEETGRAELPVIPKGCTHNAHMFYLKLRDAEERSSFIRYLKEREIMAVFHYVPLHSSPAGLRFGRFAGEDRYTTRESLRLVRLPLWYGMTKEEVRRVIQAVLSFFEEG